MGGWLTGYFGVILSSVVKYVVGVGLIKTILT